MFVSRKCHTEGMPVSKQILLSSENIESSKVFFGYFVGGHPVFFFSYDCEV